MVVMGRVLEREVTIRHHECGSDSCLKLKDLLDYLQDVAAEHADELGVGLSSIRERRELWVLSRLRLSLTRGIRCGERLRLTTYPSGVDTLFALRQYTLTSGAEVVGRGTSGWLLLSSSTFRPLRPADCLPPELLSEELPSHFPTPGKLRREAIEGARREYVVRASDLDENNHLNNAQYGRFIGDALSLPGELREVQVNYNHQALLGDVVCCGEARLPDGQVYVDGVSPDGKTSYFQAQVRLGLWG